MANYHIIKDICKKKKITLKEFSGMVPITEASLYELFKGGKARVETLEKIAKALGVPVSSFFTDDPNDRIYFSFSEIDSLLNKAYVAQLGKFTSLIFAYLVKEDDKYYITKTGILNLLFQYTNDQKHKNITEMLLDKLIEEKGDKSKK